MANSGESICLDTYDMPRRELANSLNWTDVQWVYDDMYGGVYLGGINPLTKIWDHVPKMEDLLKISKERDWLIKN